MNMKREFKIVSETALKISINFIENNWKAFLDAETPIFLIVTTSGGKRRNQQNSLYWLRLGEIAEQAWFAGKQFNTDIWHEYMKEHIMPEIITDKDGNERSKWDERPDGKLTVISTTKLSKKSFAEYTTAVEAFGASLGVLFSANPRQL